MMKFPPAERLESPALILNPVPWSEALGQWMIHPSVHPELGFVEPPEVGRMKRIMVQKECLLVWEILVGGRSPARGYLLLIGYKGPPHPVLIPFGGSETLDWVALQREAWTLLIHAFFKNPEPPRLYYFWKKPVPDPIHKTLVELGFDPMGGFPTIDNDKEVVYILHRFNYQKIYPASTE